MLQAQTVVAQVISLVTTHCAYSALFDHGLAAFFKVVVAFCNKITLCSLFFWIQVDF